MQIECATCTQRMRRPVTLNPLEQFQVQNLPGDVFAYHCTTCNGKVHINYFKDPRSGQMVARQVRLTGSPDEFRPNSIRPHEQVQIPVAYTLGSTPVTAKRQQSAQQSIAPPQPAYTLGQGARQPGQFPANHPMHPSQIRQRIQPIRLQE